MGVDVRGTITNGAYSIGLIEVDAYTEGRIEPDDLFLSGRIDSKTVSVSSIITDVVSYLGRIDQVDGYTPGRIETTSTSVIGTL